MSVRTFARTFIALWYLLGWLSHVYLAFFSPETYRVFGATALIPGFANLWQALVMPNIVGLALILAAFEVMVGGLLASLGRWVKIGLVLSLLFNLFLVQLGLGYAASSPANDFMVNRLPNLVFMGLQLPLLWGRDGQSLVILLREWWAGIWRPA